MSVRREDRQRPAEAVAGLMAAASIFVSLAAVAYRPMRIIPFTILIALIAAAIGGRQSRLAAAAVAIGALCWFAGVTLAVLIGKPLY